MKHYFQLYLHDAVVLSQFASSTQNHLCLDYIPGSAILGCIAAKFYGVNSNDAQQHQVAMSLFHNGAVQFGPVYPTAGDQLALPLPASWHSIKGISAFNKNDTGITLAKSSISNHASPVFQRDELRQYEQCRNGFINARGELANVQQQWFTKTALNEKTGSVAEGQLFNYAALSAGQYFIGWVACEVEFWQTIKPLLEGEHRLGRSKGSEFGRVSIALLDGVAEQLPENEAHRLTLWCLSDIQAVDTVGLPTYTPGLNELLPDAGLPAAQIEPAYSFVRTRHQSLFNQKRSGLDSEQLLILKGSVLVYTLEQPLTETQLVKLSQGVGINLQQGLGWVQVNPVWALQAEPPKTLHSGAIALTKAKNDEPALTDTPLLSWIKQRVIDTTGLQSASAHGKQMISEIIQAYSTARRYSGIRNSQTYGPNRTQWQRIMALLKQQDPDWFVKSFGDNTAPLNAKINKHIIAKDTADDFAWGISWDNGEHFITFAWHCKQLFAAYDTHSIINALESLNRYDLSDYSGLLKAGKELKVGLGGEL